MYEDKTPEAIKAEILAAIRQSQGLSAMAGGFADGVAGRWPSSSARRTGPWRG